MRIKIKVTKELLQKAVLCGTECDTHPRRREGKGVNCVVALAIQEILPNAYIGTYSVFSHSRCNDDDILCNLPSCVTEFIIHFDSLSGHPSLRLLMDEFDFEIDLPERAFDGVNLSEVYKILSESKILELAENFETI